jgi:type II secretory pathway pseudopilin PulG
MEKNVIIGKKSAAGVSIVEIMISLVLVAIGLLAITTVFPTMAKQRKGIPEAEQAKMIATEVIEGLQYFSSYGGCAKVNLAGMQGGNGPVQAFMAFEKKYKEDGVNMGSVKDYKVTWVLDCATSADPSKISTVTVTVTWTKNGKPHNIKMTGALL